MVSDRPMPIAPMPYEDFTPAMRAYVDAPGQDRGNALTGLLGKAGRPAELFLSYYDAVNGHESILGWKLWELVRLAVATTTRCEACLNRRNPNAVGLVEVDDPDSLFTELDSGNFSNRERAAIRYAIAFCVNHHLVDDAMWEELKALFTDEEIMTLVLFVASWLGIGRLAHVTRLIDSHCTLPGYRLAPLEKARAAPGPAHPEGPDALTG